MRLVEYALTLNIDQLIRAGGLRPWPTSGQLSWTGQSISVNFQAHLVIPDGYLRLEFVVQEGPIGSNHDVRQTITFAATRPHFGGTRWWFVCPITGERVGRLHLPPGASKFASRRAHGLAYVCQTENINKRKIRRWRKLMARLGDGHPTFGWLPLKPKLMRWTTYLRYVDQIKIIESITP